MIAPEPGRILAAELTGEARHHAGSRELTGSEEAAALAALARARRQPGGPAGRGGRDPGGHVTGEAGRAARPPGLSAWAEALVDFYDHATNTIGIDPKASAMLHDVADAAAQAAETMGAAKTRFTEHYELPREFAGNGGLMTHDGRWITGEGA